MANYLAFHGGIYENPNNFECIIYNNNNVFSNTLYIGHYKNVNKLFTQQIDFVFQYSQSMLAKFWKIIVFFCLLLILLFYIRVNNKTIPTEVF